MDKTNPGGLVALTIGLTAALATVVVALINGRQSRRDARENLKRDIELVKQLQDGRAKEMLERLIAEEIAHLGLTQSMKGERTVFLWTAMAAISAGITLLGIEIAAGRATVGFAVRMFAFAAIGLFLLLGLVLVQRMRHREAEFRPESLPQSKFRVRRALGVKRLRAAWAVLTAPEKPEDGPDNL